MIHLTLALAIVISGVVLKPLYIAILFAAGMANPVSQFQRLLLLGESLVLLGLVFAIFAVHLTRLARRLPRPVPGRWPLVIGVWFFLLTLSATVASRLVPWAVYVIGAFPTRYLLSETFTWPIIASILLYGLGQALLSAKHAP